MAKTSGMTRTGSSSSPKVGSNLKITTNLYGAKFVEGVKHANYTVAKIATDLYPGIVSGGGSNSIAFKKGASDSQIISYVSDVQALNKIHDKYQKKIDSIPKEISKEAKSWREKMIMEQLDNEMKSYYEKRVKQLNN